MTTRTTRLAFLIAAFLSIASGGIASEPLVASLEATVRLVRGGSTGTAFVVRTGKGDFLATSKHFFTDQPGESCEVVYRSGSEKGEAVRSSLTIAIREGEKELWKGHEKQDIAVLPIELPEDSAIVPLPLDRIATPGEIGKGWIGVADELHVPCYPVGTEANPAGWPVLRKGFIAAHPLAPVGKVPSFFVDMSSFGGESGAGAFRVKEDDWRVVGVVVGMQRQTERTETPLEEKTTHLPLGLAIVVQAALLRELLPES